MPATRSLIAVVGALVAATPMLAQTVTNTDDMGDGSLRDALEGAEVGAQIDFDLPTAPETITVLDATGPLLVEVGGVRIDGADAELTVAGESAVFLQLDLEEGDDPLEIVDVDLDSGTVELDGTLVYTTDVDTTLDVDIRDLAGGSGALVKRGDATLVLPGMNTYTGSTTVEEGILRLQPTSDTMLATDVEIQSGATLAWEVSGVQTLNGDLGGTGTLQVEDSGFLVLGDGAFAGTLDFQGPASVVGQGNVLRGADVDFGTSNGVLFVTGDTTLEGDLSGTGVLTIQPADLTVTLTGNNSHTSTSVVGASTLVGTPQSLPGAIDLQAPGARLQVQGSGAFGADVGGAGSFEKIGSGDVSVSVDQGYGGETLVSAGTLTLAADLTTTPFVGVSSGATLAGAGAAGNAVLEVSGTLAPGLAGDASSVGSVVSVGSAQFMPGSVLRLDVSDSMADRLDASGGVDASSATLDLDIRSGDYSSGVTHTIIASPGGVLAPGLPPSDRFPFLGITPGGGLTTFEITITGDLSDVVSPADTPNRIAIAENLQLQLDAAPPGSGFEEVGQAFVTLEGSQVSAAYDALGGESYAAFPSAHLAASQRFQRTLHRRVRGASGIAQQALAGVPQAGALRHARALAPDGDEAAPAAPRPGAWLEVWGGLGHLDGDAAADVDHQLAGASLGVDLPFGPLRLGIAAGYGFADLDLDDFETDGQAHSAHAALYAGISDVRGYASLAGRFLYARNRGDRDIAISDAFWSADADFDHFGGGVGLEAGLNLLRLGPAVLQPVASFDWMRLAEASFDESGAGALDLDGEVESVDSLQTGLGLRVGTRLELDGGVELIPELRGRWLHEFGDVDRVVSSRFEGGAVPAVFEVEGAEAPRDAALLGLGWSGVLSASLSIHADYDVLVDADRLDHLLAVRARFAF